MQDLITEDEEKQERYQPPVLPGRTAVMVSGIPVVVPVFVSVPVPVPIPIPVPVPALVLILVLLVFIHKTPSFCEIMKSDVSEECFPEYREWLFFAGQPDRTDQHHQGNDDHQEDHDGQACIRGDKECSIRRHVVLKMNENIEDKMQEHGDHDVACVEIDDGKGKTDSACIKERGETETGAEMKRTENAKADKRVKEFPAESPRTVEISFTNEKTIAQFLIEPGGDLQQE